jgi:hypothetical protein
MGRVSDQRRRASALGNEVRSRRAALCRRIESGELPLPWILRSEDWVASETLRTAQNISIGRLIRSVPGIGPVTFRQMVDDLGFDPTLPLDVIDDEMRGMIAADLEEE